ncbi:hypothetical protein Pan216_19490 [Planctomycetes bacterium Pan216]|uniref:Uncharacterized protein n=1 Tax=Kolteria novifilia TaxID=2527975 RepID=A0A518B287_9BACT|nr:hypothetical protein Pan216_19490 [Planctomycetes bacterium Pan216]
MDSDLRIKRLENRLNALIGFVIAGAFAVVIAVSVLWMRPTSTQEGLTLRDDRGQVIAQLGGAAGRALQLFDEKQNVRAILEVGSNGPGLGLRSPDGELLVMLDGDPKNPGLFLCDPPGTTRLRVWMEKGRPVIDLLSLDGTVERSFPPASDQ